MAKDDTVMRLQKSDSKYRGPPEISTVHEERAAEQGSSDY
jgi:hypothetical protein